jgi:acyl-CoA hydrolase
MLSELKVTCDVFRIGFQQLLEMRGGGVVVADLHAFQREAVAGECVRGFFGDKLFQDFAARLLCLGHGMKARIIAGLRSRAKRAHFALNRARSTDRSKRMPKTSKTNRKSVPAKISGAAATGSGAASPAPGKPVSASTSEIVEIVLPNDANLLGNMLGGRVMHLIDIAGALAANRHSNSHVVTASVDYLDFRFPIHVGEWIVLKSSVNRVFHTSMEVGVKVFAENILTGERRHTSTAYVTFVALDTNQQPRQVPPLILQTEDERRRYREAGERRRIRLSMRHKTPPADS